MSEILKKVSSYSIKSYIEQNLDDFYIRSSKHHNFISHLEDKLCWVLAKNADWPEAIYKADFQNLNVEDEIGKIKQDIIGGIAPNGWTVGPLTTPKNLGDFLEKSGFSNVYQQAGMALNLKRLENTAEDEGDLVIEVVDNIDSLKQWTDVVSNVFGIKVDSELIEYLFLVPEAVFYIGRVDEKPVSSLMLYLSSGVAGLHAVSTLMEYRNRGYGLIISKKALLDAFNMGYRVGVLQASTMGERVYSKLGFKKYCDIISYELDI